RVARVNAAVAASLAWAPKTPLVVRAPGQGGFGRGARGGTNPSAEGAAPATPPATANAATAAVPGGRRPTPMISRGSGYDAVLQWRAAGSDADIKGYSVLVRATTATAWEQEIYVGKVTTFTLKDVSIDDSKFGVKAIGNDGSESLVSAYVYPSRVKTEVETVQSNRSGYTPTGFSTPFKTLA